jgi:hypothetical protein
MCTHFFFVLEKIHQIDILIIVRPESHLKRLLFFFSFLFLLYVIFFLKYEETIYALRQEGGKNADDFSSAPITNIQEK